MPMTVQPSFRSSTGPLYQGVYEHLRQRIFDGELPPRARVETEQALARRHGVSVGTVRKAQELLVHEGLLIKRQGRGCFVAPDATATRRVLWVCGVDLFGGDISPYFLHFLHYCRAHAERAGIRIEPVWLSNDRPEDADPYCTPASTRQHLGYLFVGCEYPKHRMLRYAVQAELPHVHVDGDEPRPNRLVLDRSQGIRLGVEHLLERGCSRIAVITQDKEKMRHALDQAIAPYRDRVEPMLTPSYERMSSYEHAGYRLMAERIAREAVPSGLLIVDDIVARGVTRALLEHGPTGGAHPAVAVCCGMQEAVPLGLPVTYLVHDVEAEAQQAIHMLQQQLESRQGAAEPFISTFSIQSRQEALAGVI
ncbi:MAG: GntR family transcriptional regulator [Phycisphaeraceae bacterium]